MNPLYVGIGFQQLTEQFNRVQFSPSIEARLTDWVSGKQEKLHFQCNSFGSLRDAIADAFLVEMFRIYVLQSPEFSWSSRFQLTAENFDDYVLRLGRFARPKVSQLYVHSDQSPTTSPTTSRRSRVLAFAGGKKADASEGSQKSSRSGQTEFHDAILRRDKGKCVFCSSSESSLEGAHILPVEKKDILNDPSVCARFCIGSINDASNGILLCWACHKCFDHNLVCIDPDDGKLLVSDALLANEPDKWNALVGQVVPRGQYAWPSRQLLLFRHEAMVAATAERHATQVDFQSFCQYCSKG